MPATERDAAREMVTSHRYDTDLGSWTQASWEPAPGDPLTGAVERIWDFEGSLTYRRERVFPNGMLELVVQLDRPHRPVLDGPAPPFPPLCIDGLQTVATTIEGPPGKCRVLGLRLHPCGAYALLRASLRDLTDTHADLHAILGHAADELAQPLASLRDGRDRIRAAAAWARARLLRANGPDPAVALALRRIDRDGGAASIGLLGELTGRSRARLTAAFHDHVGVTPKRYARLVRFRRALEALVCDVPLGAVALSAGYYDQAHLTTEFREHAGLTPGAYRAAIRFPSSSHLAEKI